MALENGWLEYFFPFGMAIFQGRTVSFRERALHNFHFPVTWPFPKRNGSSPLTNIFSGAFSVSFMGLHFGSNFFDMKPRNLRIYKKS